MLTLDQLVMASHWYDLKNRLCPNLPKEDGTNDFEKRIAIPYSEPHRAYHNLMHIEACLRHFHEMVIEIIQSEAPALWVDQQQSIVDSLELAIWFHDIVYDPQSSNNEEESVLLMKKFCSDFSVDKYIMNDAAHLIMCTKSHNEAITIQDKLMNDIDLSILGESPKVFWAYEHGIRKEYSLVPDDVYRVERSKIMKKFADKEKHGKLFQTEMFYDRFNSQARENLRHLIAYLDR